MKSKSLKKTAIATALLLSVGSIALPALSHQSGQGSNHGAHGGNAQMTGGSSMMDMMSGKGMMDMMGGKGMMEMMGGNGMMGMMGGKGMMDGSGMMGMMGGLRALDLSEEQRRDVNAEHDRLRKKHWETMGQIMDQQSKLRDALSADRPDPTTVGQVYGKIFDLRRQMIETGIESRNTVQDLLSEEQVTQLKQHQKSKGMMGQGAMMSKDGSMGGGMMQGQGG